MKIASSTALILSVLITLGGCSSPKEESSLPEISSTVEATSETVSDIISSEEVISEKNSEDETNEPEISETTASDAVTTAADKLECPYDYDFEIERIDGKKLKFSEADEWTENTVFYRDFAVARFTTGITYDSNTNPDMFDVKNYGFTGDMYSIVPEWFEVHKGDTFCDGALTVTDVETSYQYGYDTETQSLNYAEIMTNNITFDGEITLKGRFVCAKEVDLYISVGDVIFTPYVDSITNFPMPSPALGASSWAADMSDAYILDSFSQTIGNINEDSILDEYLDSGETKSLEITLSDISMTFNEQFGGRMNAKIKSISEYIF